MEFSHDFPGLREGFTILDVVLNPRNMDCDITFDKIALSDDLIREYFQKAGIKDKELEGLCVKLYQKYGA
ncbi:MAG: hypothetical protein NTU61_05500, partial [Candidatus Altiarchaeota archaeon]|nr:hypothetical protein [Candidatus Altiarchaeota archaeon]